MSCFKPYFEIYLYSLWLFLICHGLTEKPEKIAPSIPHAMHKYITGSMWSQLANAKRTKAIDGSISPTIVLSFLVLVLDNFSDAINQSENLLHGVEKMHNNK